MNHSSNVYQKTLLKTPSPEKYHAEEIRI
ncbi:unnamed protein product, partial [Rotaria sordida]